MEPLEQAALLGPIDQPHRAALEPERGELLVGEFDEDVHDGVAQAADVELFHASHLLQGQLDPSQYFSFPEDRQRLEHARPAGDTRHGDAQRLVQRARLYPSGGGEIVQCLFGRRRVERLDGARASDAPRSSSAAPGFLSTASTASGSYSGSALRNGGRTGGCR